MIAWSKELRADIILEQLGDGIDNWLKVQAADHDLVCVGVTAHPSTLSQRLKVRNQQTGQEIGPTELVNAIRGFSRPDGFAAMVRHSRSAVLLSHDSDGYDVVLGAEGGQVQFSNAMAYSLFCSYADMADADLLQRMSENRPAGLDRHQAPVVT